MRPSRAAAGKARWVALAIVATLLVVAWAVWRLWTDQGFVWSRFAATFRNLDWRWMAASLLFSLSTYLGRALRWRVLIRPLKRHPSLWKLFSATAIGFSAIVLFGRPGEMVRPYLIAVKEKLSFSSQMAAWLVERIYDLIMALLIFGLALSRVKASGVQVGERLSWVLQAGGLMVGVVGVACIIIFLALRLYGESSEKRIIDGLGFLPEQHQFRAASMIRAFRQGVESTKSLGAVLSVLAYSVLEWLLITGTAYCLFQAIPEVAGLSLIDVLIFLGFVSFGSVVQIPGVGGGMQIVSVVVLTEMYALPLDVSTGVALLIWMVTFVVVVPVGLALAFHDGLRWSKLKDLDPETID